MSRDLIRFMQSFFTPTLAECRGAGWRPAADVYRMADGWMVKLDIAGLRAEDIRIEVYGNRLLVSGQRRDMSQTRECRCHHMEIAYSQFERGFEQHWDLKHSSITTDYRDGMLHLYIRTETER